MAEQVSSVMAVTGCSADQAKAGLEASDWQVEAAVNLLLAAGTGFDTGDGTQAAQPQEQYEQLPMGEDYIRPAMEMGGGAQRLIGGVDEGDMDFDGMDAIPGLPRIPGLGLGDPGRNPAAPNMADILGATRANEASGAPSFSFAGSLEEAREKGNREGKWLIVNLVMPYPGPLAQSKRIWGEDVTSAVVQSGFIFWQDNPDGAEADRLLRNHGLTDPECPLTMIIDPRTGEKVAHWNGALSPEEIQAKLQPYAADPLDPMEPASPMGAGGASYQDESMDLGDSVGDQDQALQQAIAASMGGGNQAGNMDDDEAMRRAIEASLEAEGGGDDPDVVEIPPPVRASGGSPPASAPAATPPTPPAPEWHPTVDLARYFADDKGEGYCTFRIQMTDSSLHTKHVRKDCPTVGLFDWVKSEVEEARGREFDLKFGFPPRPLTSSAEVTVEEAKLAGEKITMVWA